MDNPATESEQKDAREDMFYKLLGLRPASLDKRMIDITMRDFWECQNFWETADLARQQGQLSSKDLVALIDGYRS